MDPAISYDAVTYAYPRAIGEPERRPAVERVSLSVAPGERLGVLGPNGGGKSTLLKLTLGVLRPDAGSVRVLGYAPAEARRMGLVGYVPQKIEAELSFPISVRQAVSMTASRGVPAWRGLPREGADAVREAIELVGVAELADRPIGKLSGGQLQRAMIARALAGRPKVLLLDEPTVGIDPAGQRRFAELLRGLTARLGLTIVIVSHDIRAIAAGCDRVACLGRTLHYHDSPQGLTPGVLAEVFTHDVAGIFGDVHVEAHQAGECAAHGHPSPPGHTHVGPCCSHEHARPPNADKADGA